MTEATKIVDTTKITVKTWKRRAQRRFNRLAEESEGKFHIQLGETLGSGASGAVFQASVTPALEVRNPYSAGVDSFESVAVKVLFGTPLRSAAVNYRHAHDTFTRFMREVSIQAELRDELARYESERHVVRLLRYGILPADHAPDIPYMIFESVPLRPLSLCAEGKRLSSKDAASIVYPLAHVARILHEGVSAVHRDIKPDNVLVSDDLSEVRLADFGIAKKYSEFNGLELGPVGTLGYCAPEQLIPDASVMVGPWSDVYSLGAIGYQLLTGVFPYEGQFRNSRELGVLMGSGTRESSLAKLLKNSRTRHREFESLVTAALDVDARNRPRSREFEQGLGRVVESFEPVVARLFRRSRRLYPAVPKS